MQRPSFLSNIAVFAMLTLAPALPAICLAQVSTLDPAIVQKQAMSEKDKSDIESFVKANSAALGGKDAIALKNARNNLLKPLEKGAATAGFRIAYGAAVLNAVDSIIKTGEELQAANALRLAGELATSSAVSSVKLGLASDKPGVRYAATFGYARSFDAVERGFRAGSQPALTASNMVGMVRDLSAIVSGTTERDPQVLDGAVLALAAAVRIPDSAGQAGGEGFGPRPLAAEELAKACSVRIKAATDDGPAATNLTKMLLRIAEPLGLPLKSQFTQEFKPLSAEIKTAMRTAGSDMKAYAQRLETKPTTPPVDADFINQLKAAGEQLVKLAK